MSQRKQTGQLKANSLFCGSGYSLQAATDNGPSPGNLEYKINVDYILLYVGRDTQDSARNVPSRMRAEVTS